MEKITNVNEMLATLPKITTHDHAVTMVNGKRYRVYGCFNHAQVYKYMRSQGFNAKDIVSVDLIAKA
jgi:hypothetical protein